MTGLMELERVWCPMCGACGAAMSPDDDETLVMERLAEGLDHVVRSHPEASPSLDALQVVTIAAPVTGPADFNDVVTPAFPRLPLGESWGDYEAGRLAVGL